MNLLQILKLVAWIVNALLSAKPGDNHTDPPATT